MFATIHATDGLHQYLSQRGIALSCLPCKSDKFTTPLACLRHAVWANQTGMEAHPCSLRLHSSLADLGCMPQASQWSSKFVTLAGQAGQGNASLTEILDCTIPPKGTPELHDRHRSLFSHLLSDFLTSGQFIEPSEQLALSYLSRHGR